MREFTPRSLWFTRVALSFTLAAPLMLGTVYRTLNDGTYNLELELASSVGGMLQVFYDRGNGITEADSSVVPIRPSTTILVDRVPIPAGTYRTLRIDPPGAEATFTIAAVRITSGNDTTIAEIPLQRLIPAVQLSILNAGPPLVLASPPTSTDPQIIWTPDTPLVLERATRSVVSIALTGLVAWLAMLGVIMVLERVLSPLGPRVVRTFDRVAGAGERRPRIAVLAAAIAGTMIAMYPVIFLGRSLVSPSNGGTFLLYDRAPFTPGSDDLLIEDPRGTDIGAGMWAFVPYSHVQRMALLAGELPFWNRYNAAGRPLWGQGQTQILDPLHWLTLLPRDPAPGWDAKFVVHRAVFAFGLGLCVLMLTASWPAAALVAFTAPFAAYFIFRLNHPAQFTLTYAGWALCAWIALSRAARRSELYGAAAGLALTTALMLVASPPKEAVVMILCVHGAGVLMLILAPESWTLLARRLAAAAAGGIVAALLSTPHWLVFLDTLGSALTDYDRPAARFASWPYAMMLIFGVMAPGGLPMPGAHAAVFATAVAAVASRATFRRASSFAVVVAPVAALAIAFGAVPERVIIALPFFANIHQIDYTFLAGGIVLLFVASGVGSSVLMREAGTRTAAAIAGAILVAGVVTLYYAGGLAGLGHSIASWAMLASLAIAAMLPALIVVTSRVWPAPLPVFAVAIALFALIIPNGFHVPLGSRLVDGIVIQPRPRVALEQNSSAVDAIFRDAGTAAIRVAGVDQVLFPGSSALYELESIGGPDALQLPWYEELVITHGIVRNWNWATMIPAASMPRAQPFLDLLGVGYLLGRSTDNVPDTVDVALDAPDLVRVLRRRGPWPRAFFTTAVSTYATTPEFIEQLRRAEGPFASVQRSDDDAMRAASGLNGGRVVTVPADRLQITPNTTRFRVRTPGVGVVVLTETWMPSEFEATLNGDRVPYFRINHAFKGVKIPGAGEWELTFRFRPRRWRVSLAAAIAGAISLALLWLLHRRPN